MVSIRLKDISKVFTIHKGKNATLKEKIIYRKQSNIEQYWALKSVNYEIHQGKTVGIIGRNGSGKSTLLKLITRIIYPTSGSVEINGKVSSLLELGAGFHPDFTGRENIYMNAAILGFSKKEIDNMIDNIISFSELEQFIDNPLRSYSSGMYMRLAFSVAINVSPDILLIDEILSVGDTAFQKKCINRLRELKRMNKTIVIVSHDNVTLELLCDEIIWLKNGGIYRIGDAKTIINEYLDYISDEDGNRYNTQQLEKANELNVQVQNDEELSIELSIDQNKKRWGNGKIRIKDVSILNDNMQESYFFTSGESITLKVKYTMKEKLEDIIFGFRITTLDGINCYGTNTHIDDYVLLDLPLTGAITCHIDSLSLVEGNYQLDFAFHQTDGTAYDYYCGGYSIQIKSTVHDTGIAKLSHRWSI